MKYEKERLKITFNINPFYSSPNPLKAKIFPLNFYLKPNLLIPLLAKPMSLYGHTR